MQQVYFEPKHTRFLTHQTNKTTKQKRTKNNALLLIILILWNVFLTYQVIKYNSIIPQFTDKQNEIIMQLEEIPMEVLEVE